ncbi:hypothetical protein [Ekhidna sp.]|uniref:hypothetical protein n=1 Tax=Ekhidna sp. TaxID=2608089 RepID=UPI00329A1F4A
MKKLHLATVVILLVTFTCHGQSVIELEPSQSMSISGKGPGQDAAINPYLATNSIGIIENIGKNQFSIRVQEKNKIIKTIQIKPDDTKEIILLKGYELYFDSELKAKVKVDFKKMKE